MPKSNRPAIDPCYNSSEVANRCRYTALMPAASSHFHAADRAERPLRRRGSRSARL